MRWAAVLLTGAGLGGLAALNGYSVVATALGGVLSLISLAIVSATVLATYFTSGPVSQLAGSGLFRAVTLGFFGAGLAAGGLMTVAWPLVIAGLAGLVVLLLTREP